MPARDGTGPMGQGPETGRRNGGCVESDASGDVTPVPGRGSGYGGGRGRGQGRGQGRGRGAGRGRCHRGGYGPDACAPPPELTREQEVEALKAQAEQFDKAQEDIRRRIQELESAETAQKE